MVGVARHASKSGRRSTFIILAVVLVAAAAGVAGGVVIYRHGRPHGTSSSLLVSGRPRATSLPTTTAPTTTTTTTTTTTSTLPPPGPGFVAGHVTAVGDSVMIDYEIPLRADIPGITVQDAVSRQWGTGETLLQDDKTAGQLGAEVIVALGTNGPIT